MKRVLLAWVIALVFADIGVACADNADASDIVILAVKPRDPGVKPIIMSVPIPQGRQTTAPEQSIVPAAPHGDSASDRPAETALRQRPAIGS